MRMIVIKIQYKATQRRKIIILTIGINSLDDLVPSRFWGKLPSCSTRCPFIRRFVNLPTPWIDPSGHSYRYTLEVKYDDRAIGYIARFQTVAFAPLAICRSKLHTQDS